MMPAAVDSGVEVAAAAAGASGRTAADSEHGGQAVAFLYIYSAVPSSTPPHTCILGACMVTTSTGMAYCIFPGPE